MQSKDEYEQLAEHLEAILTDILDMSDKALQAARTARFVPRLDRVSQVAHREYLMDNLEKLARGLLTGKDYNLRTLVHLAEQVGLGLEGEKSEKRMVRLTKKAKSKKPATKKHS